MMKINQFLLAITIIIAVVCGGVGKSTVFAADAKHPDTPGYWTMISDQNFYIANDCQIHLTTFKDADGHIITVSFGSPIATIK